jgi:fido (protein-threonine AMPylation protein)
MYFDEKPYDEEVLDLPYQTRLELWNTSFGLQQTDGLIPSDYMIELAQKNIEGVLSYQEIKENISEYYKSESVVHDRTQEADYSSLRIAEILSTDAFSFSPATLLNYHKRLFSGIDSFHFPVGKFRDTNITKAEEVLNGDTVNYADFREIKDTLNWDFEQEKDFQYSNLERSQQADHAMKFISGIWQIHPFREGNTRTTAVFAIKYFRSLGFSIDNTPFKDNAKYFRDALVLDNAKADRRTNKFLNLFTKNFLLDKNLPLNREDMFTL